jgi:hypothetical protein
MTGQYILMGKLAIPEDDLMAWARWFETADRKVARTDLDYGFWVSTVFLGIDHAIGRAPRLYETMVFHEDDGREVSIQNAEGEHLLLLDRYETWGEAEKGHAKIVARLEKWISLLTDQKIRPTWALLQTNQGDTDDD